MCYHTINMKNTIKYFGTELTDKDFVAISVIPKQYYYFVIDALNKVR